MGVQPRPSLARIVGIGCALLFLALEPYMAIGYDEIGATTSTISKGIVIPLAVGSLGVRGRRSPPPRGGAGAGLGCPSPPSRWGRGPADAGLR